MTDLDAAQLCAQRVRGLADWRTESRDMVVHLGELLGFDPPEEFADQPRLGLATMDELLAHEHVVDLSTSDDVQLFTQVMYYLAEYVIRKFNGEWTVDTDADSPTFARYLVTCHAPDDDLTVSVDIAEHVHAFLRQPAPRSLLTLVITVEREIVEVLDWPGHHGGTDRW